MPELRLRFSRTGTAKYLSHLDVFRCFSRAFSRVGIPLAFSQGFNPHPYISVAHPLSVGVEGMNEILDFAVVGEESLYDCETLNAALPEGLRALELYKPDTTIKSIEFAEYRLEFDYDGEAPTAEQIEAFFAADEIIITKKTKGGIKPVNLRKSYLNLVATRRDSTLVCHALLHAADSPINPRYFAGALEHTPLKPDAARFTRLCFVRKKSGSFR